MLTHLPEHYNSSYAVLHVIALQGKGSLFWGIGNLTLPTNFDVGLPGYQCTLPAPVAAGRSVPVSMTGRQYYTAISSYDFTCAPTAQYAAKPKCCVSFSGGSSYMVCRCDRSCYSNMMPFLASLISWGWFQIILLHRRILKSFGP